jgi:hypothetical protein
MRRDTTRHDTTRHDTTTQDCTRQRNKRQHNTTLHNTRLQHRKKNTQYKENTRSKKKTTCLYEMLLSSGRGTTFTNASVRLLSSLPSNARRQVYIRAYKKRQDKTGTVQDETNQIRQDEEIPFIPFTMETRLVFSPKVVVSY